MTDGVRPDRDQRIGGERTDLVPRHRQLAARLQRIEIGRGGKAGDESGEGRPLTFWQAAAFQWVNPKGLIIAFGAAALYVRPETAVRDFAVMLVVFTVATFGSTLTWAGFGVALRKVLQNERQARIFNVVMALLLVASIAPMVL